MSSPVSDSPATSAAVIAPGAMSELPSPPPPSVSSRTSAEKTWLLPILPLPTEFAARSGFFTSPSTMSVLKTVSAA